ncbi:MAG TPA: type IV secretory system conjugative DNA transfer family protein, partial [Dyella sp.]|nr:type IV secretory system conjugative DNA transfer family protein [Dyella sp.]
MSLGWKAGMLTALLILALVGGEYLAGWLLIFWLHIPVQLGLGTYWEYFQAINLPQLVPYAGKIKIAGYLGFGVPLLVWLMLLVLMFRPQKKAFYGDARFATRRDASKAKLLQDSAEGVVFGLFGREFLRLCGTEHIMVVAPTRSGKSTGIAIPVLMTYGHSIVVLDLKGELYRITSGWRAQHLGQKIFVFAPYDATRRTHRFNPFTTMSTNPALRLGELQTMAAILYPDSNSKDPFWINQARNAFVAFASYMFERWDQLVIAAQKENIRLDVNKHLLFPSFQRIFKLSTGPGYKNTKAMVDAYLSHPDYAFLSDEPRTAFASLASLAEQTFSSVIGSMQEPLQQFLSPILAGATNATDFDVAMLRRQRMTLYVVVPPEKLGEASKLLNIFFSTAIGQNLRQAPQDDPTIKNQMLLLLDEFTAMGRIDVLSKNISLIAGYWIRCVTIIQSLSQLDSVYGEHDARNIVTNHSVVVAFTPREQRDAEEYSRQMGDTTERRRNKTIGSDGRPSYTHSEERRPLMLPQELKVMPDDQQLAFVKGCHPIKSGKIRYFKMRFFTKRLLPKVEIPAIPADLQPTSVVRVVDEAGVRLL